MFYAKSTGGFYAHDIHAENIPSDAVELSASEHAILLAGQSSGKRIVADENGRPFLADPPPISPLEVWEQIKAERDRRKAGGVKVGTKWYHSDTESRIQHLGLKDQARDLVAAGRPDTTRLQKLGQDIRWKTLDGSFEYLTVKHAFDIVDAVGDLDALAFVAAETHRAVMEQSPDPSTYDFTAGWPATFDA